MISSVFCHENTPGIISSRFSLAQVTASGHCSALGYPFTWALGSRWKLGQFCPIAAGDVGASESVIGWGAGATSLIGGFFLAATAQMSTVVHR